MTSGDFVIQHNQTVVFAGDSITEAGRHEEQAPLGIGYVAMATAMAAAGLPDRRLRVINAGVGGDTIVHLAKRWDADVLAHRPDWLTVSIGINDVWRQFDSNDGGVSLDDYKMLYRELLERTRARLSGCGFILMTPSVIEEDPASEGNRRLATYAEAVEQLAAKYNAFCVPVHRIFLDAIARGNGRAWTTDGVHLHAEGHGLMALAWLRTLGWRS